MNHPFRPACLGLGVLLLLGACENMTTGEGTTAISGRDSCGAIDHQDLVGQSAAALDASALPEGTRVLYPGMPATTDFRPDRMSVEVGGGDTVARVVCG
ncbi:I78 family peptidase inhibitor [Amaricoccus sp. W119]|uniref:I78 family peptidase inhibitor n=1 Tax=Amaricoccus sp. W119 TaxID=3391833 RepID=UPI0039A67C90